MKKKIWECSNFSNKFSNKKKHNNEFNKFELIVIFLDYLMFKKFYVIVAEERTSSKRIYKK